MNEDNHLKKRRTSPTSSPLRDTPPRYHCNNNNIINSSSDESPIIIRSSPRLLLLLKDGDFLSTTTSTPSRNNVTSLFSNNHHRGHHEEKKEDDPLLPYCGGNSNGGNDVSTFNDNGVSSSSLMRSSTSFSTVTIVMALSSLFIMPLLIWDDYYVAATATPSEEASSSAVLATVMGCLRHIELIWCALLHISIWPVVILTAMVACYYVTVTNNNSSGRGCANNKTKGAAPSNSSLGGASASAVVPSTAPILSTLSKSIHCIIATSNHKSVAQYKVPILLSILLSILISTQSFIQMAFPSLLWNPGAWLPIGLGLSGSRVYLPGDVIDGGGLVGDCFNVDDNLATDVNSGSFVGIGGESSSSSFLRSSSSSSDHHHQQQHKSSSLPLCLTEQQWQQLSSGTLSSSNPKDVTTVYRGLKYLQNESNGIVINVLARNVVDSIPDLRRNVEGLVPFLGSRGKKEEGEGSGGKKTTKLSLVVFENDSVDGTREEFIRWADEVNHPHPTTAASSSSLLSRYNVDLITCPPPNTNCKLNIADRNEAYGVYNKTASGVGKLGEFRQLTVDYVMKHYGTYSHMIVLDVDLGVSISPLGIVHSLGMMMKEDEEKETGQNDGSGGGGQEVHVAEKYVVASAATQLWPGTFGTIAPPYDLSAFRPKPTPSNIKVRTLQRKFCELMPPGDRWRNMCDAPSPMQLFMILQNNDPLFHHGDPYEVASAFNGITMYPIGLIRSRGAAARYDAGSDGQRCEHIGFNLSLRDTMMVNPKWVMHLKPNKPGGPSGFHTVTKVFAAMSKRQNVTTVLSAVNMMSLFVFVLSVWIISLTMKERVIPSMIDFFVGLRNRSETSFLYGYWLDFTGRGGSSSLSQHQSLQLRVMSDEEGKKLLS